VPARLAQVKLLGLRHLRKASAHPLQASAHPARSRRRAFLSPLRHR